MTLRAFREQCKLFIEKNDFENTFQLFANNLNTDSEYAHLVIAQKGHHKSIFDKDMNGLMSRQDADVEYAKIRRSLLYIIGNMQESDLGAGASLNDPLDKLAEQLPVNSALSPLYLVNCDRKKPVRTFWRSFDALHAEKQRFQFYYILACPSQEPDGFSERMVYELLEKDLESPQVIHYKQKADSGRLQVEPLPQGHNR